MSAEDTKKALDKRMSLKEAVSRVVFDGCSIAFSGMGGQQVVAPTYEIVRQGQKDLTLMGDSPCECADYLVGTGQIKRMEVAWLAFAVAGISPNYRRAVENGIPHKIEVREFSNYTMGLRFLAGAMGLPFMTTKSLIGSSIEEYNDMIKVIDDPYGGNKVAVVPAAIPGCGDRARKPGRQAGKCSVSGFLLQCRKHRTRREKNDHHLRRDHLDRRDQKARPIRPSLNTSSTQSWKSPLQPSLEHVLCLCL